MSELPSSLLIISNIACSVKCGNSLESDFIASSVVMFLLPLILNILLNNQLRLPLWQNRFLNFFYFLLFKVQFIHLLNYIIYFFNLKGFLLLEVLDCIQT
jgi:hypothetical protein